MATAAISAGLQARPGRPRWQRWALKPVPGIISFVGFVVIWQLVILVFDPKPILLPGPADVWREFIDTWAAGDLWPPVIDSMRAMAVGLAISLVIGIPVGLAIGMSPTADLITSPYLWGFFAMPRIALAPILILILGFGYEVKVWLVILSAIIPIILSCKDGVQTTDESLVRAAQSFGAGRIDMFAKVIAPNTLPFIASGVRNGISRGFVGLLVIELTTGSGGIGSEVMQSMRNFNTARMFAFTGVLIAIALVLVSLSRKVEGYASRWREEVVV